MLTLGTGFRDAWFWKDSFRYALYRKPLQNMDFTIQKQLDCIVNRRIEAICDTKH